MLEDVLGCKWTLTIIDLVRRGVKRPGAMQRSVAGLTQKVLNERLRKLARFGILEKHCFPEVPPRVEYELTDFGRRFVGVLDAIDALAREAANLGFQQARKER
ncbi:MAG: helix-turn-helix domain-containing protein [Sutterellaceae bacterium]|nr:helix-turn-helix transcriptional regulator [Burkholderiaceae bacterium]MDW8429480.1 helix-turn-helix domain-containing protein [Sutterellaceae bacterium]